MIVSKFFKEKEFNACTPSCSLNDMQESTIDMLDRAREIADMPFVLTSAYRSSEYDRAKGRSGKGAHTKGYGVDILCASASDRITIVRALLAVGFPRIGIGKNFVHADNDPELPRNVMWHYY